MEPRKEFGEIQCTYGKTKQGLWVLMQRGKSLADPFYRRFVHACEQQRQIPKSFSKLPKFEEFDVKADISNFSWLGTWNTYFTEL